MNLSRSIHLLLAMNLKFLKKSWCHVSIVVSWNCKNQRESREKWCRQSEHLEIIVACDSNFCNKLVWLKCLQYFICQCISDHVLNQLVKLHYPLSDKESSQRKPSVLTHEETLGLHYAAGYILRSLKKKLLKSPNPLIKRNLKFRN